MMFKVIVLKEFDSLRKISVIFSLIQYIELSFKSFHYKKVIEDTFFDDKYKYKIKLMLNWFNL